MGVHTKCAPWCYLPATACSVVRVTCMHWQCLARHSRGQMLQCRLSGVTPRLSRGRMLQCRLSGLALGVTRVSGNTDLCAGVTTVGASTPATMTSAEMHRAHGPTTKAVILWRLCEAAALSCGYQCTTCQLLWPTWCEFSLDQRMQKCTSSCLKLRRK